MKIDHLQGYIGDFVPQLDQMLAAILFLMKEHPGITQYQVVKSIFLADKDHLNSYGRPITYDKYVAMQQGPVPSLTYDLLKPNGPFKALFKHDAPWSFSEDGKVRHYVAQRMYDADVLSKTDIKALRSALTLVLHSTPQFLSKILHEDAAYIEAWSKRGEAKSVRMRTVKLLTDEDQELIDHLSYATKIT